MVNIETGKIVDILASRDADSVTRWLKNYPKIKYASRDGSMTYAKAITNANEKINQITDRFHLIKGLCDGIVKYFQGTIPGRIAIPITDESKMLISINYSSMHRLEKAEYVKSLHKKGYSTSEIHRQVGTNMATIKKYLDLSDEEIKKSKITAKERDHLNATQKVVKKVLLVKKIYKETNSIRAVSRITGITIAKINEYLKEDFNPVNAHYGISRGGVLPKYKNEIFTMKNEGKTSVEIAQYIKSQGYSITDAAIRAYLTKERRIIKDLIGQNSSPKEMIERSVITSLLYHPLSKIKRLTEKQYIEIIKVYPILDDIYKLINTLKDIFISNNVRKLNSWIKKAISLKIDEITSFTESLKTDIIAVKNAVKLPYSNGLAEGSVNKLKLIKRIMYGRCSFDTLRTKALLREYFF